MVQTNSGVTLEEVMNLVKQLSPVDQLRLIERVAPEIERALTVAGRKPSVSLLGLAKDLGPAPTADDIDAARREARANFPRDAN